jgi:hypothetical protein
MDCEDDDDDDDDENESEGDSTWGAGGVTASQPAWILGVFEVRPVT